MADQRVVELMNAAADALDDGRDPFQEAFLTNHNVTLDEVYILSEALALGARLYLDVIDQIERGGIHAQVAAQSLARTMSFIGEPQDA